MENRVIFPLAYEIVKSGTNNETVLHWIFPTKQVVVDKILEWAKETETVERITVFGSALNTKCGIGSDLDIAIKVNGGEDEDVFLKVIRPIRRKLFEEQIDWINADEVAGSALESEILMNGMLIYERECTGRFST